MTDRHDWMAEAARSGMTPRQAAQERAQDDFTDAGTALLRQLSALRRSVRRLRQDDE